MKHLRYLRYVILHKLYVFAGGVAIARTMGSVYARGRGSYWPRFLWRLLVHDLSKFRPSEWVPYVEMFYGEPIDGDRGVKIRAARMAAFNLAWLKHIHRNPHHWQHWLLQQDDGRKVWLLPEAMIADEMIADWLGAGTKILRLPTLAECVAETILWYMSNREIVQLRGQTRDRVEETLHTLAQRYGLLDMAMQVQMAKAARESIVVPGR